jgi:hypothetical protein
MGFFDGLLKIGSTAAGFLTGNPWIGTAVGAGLDYFSGKQSANQAHDWAMKADNTKYQRQVIDMQKAGLNPGLAYSTGASVPSGVAPVAQSARSAEAMTSGANTTMAARAQRALLPAQVQNSLADTELKKAQAAQARTQAVVTAQSAARGAPFTEAVTSAASSARSAGKKAEDWLTDKASKYYFDPDARPPKKPHRFPSKRYP